MNIMRWSRNGIRAAAFGAVALVMSWCGSALAGASAPPPITITIDENCNGTSSSGGVTTSLLCAVEPDPSPGGVPLVMGYAFGGTILGDLVLQEPGAGTSDVIRFFGGLLALGPLPAQTLGSVILFYSDNSDGVDALADLGLPTAPFGTQFTVTEAGSEGNNGFIYTPLPGQPGFVPGFAATYDIHSDSVPEPATLALLGIGLAGLGFSRRQRKE